MRGYLRISLQPSKMNCSVYYVDRKQGIYAANAPAFRLVPPIERTVFLISAARFFVAVLVSLYNCFSSPAIFTSVCFGNQASAIMFLAFNPNKQP